MRIDETALDIEWLEQASLAMKYGRYWADCKRAATHAEEKVKVIRADLIKKANSNPQKYCGKDKPNAADIEAFYRKQPEHIAAKDAWVDAQYELDMAEVAKNEISFTRKAALENLVKLHGQLYFAGPKVPRDLFQELSGRKSKRKITEAGTSQSQPKRTKHYA